MRLFWWIVSLLLLLLHVRTGASKVEAEGVGVGMVAPLNDSPVPINMSLEELMRKEVAEEYPSRDPLSIAIPMTIIYSLILLSGLVGNISTCIVISRISYMHTATNFYLFSLSMSDLLLLISGVPQIWKKYPYIFGEGICVVRGLAAETSANATVLTITAFTVERFVAIVYPLKGHLLSQLSRVIRMIALIWLIAFCMALPQAAQFGIKDMGAWCTLVRDDIFPYAFQISICVFFAIPMTLIAVLYLVIGVKLRHSRNKGPVPVQTESGRQQQSHVIRMLDHIMSNKFRQAFWDAVHQFCGTVDDPEFGARNYSVMSKRSNRLGHMMSGSSNSLGGSFQSRSNLRHSPSAANMVVKEGLSTIEESVRLREPEVTRAGGKGENVNANGPPKRGTAYPTLV